MYQVPLPLVVFRDKTWGTKGIHGSVYFYHPVAVSGKGFCSIKLYFSQHGIQPNVTVIFQVKWGGIADFDKQAYEDDVFLF